MKRAIPILLFFSSMLFGATENISSVAVGSNGYSVAVTIPGMDTGGTWRFNKGVANAFTDTTPFIYVKTPGYNVSGQRNTAIRKIRVDTVFRKNYPANGYDSCETSGSDTVWYLHLHMPIFSSDTIDSISFPRCIYRHTTDTLGVYTASTCTNNSTVTPTNFKAGARWTWPERTMWDTSFYVSMTGIHVSSDSGKMFRLVIFSASDNHSHTVYDTVTESTSGGHPYITDSIKIEEYIGFINTATFVKGDSITLNFKALPPWGDSIWTGDGVNTTKPTPLYAPQYYGYNEYHDVLVDSAAGNDGTGVVTNHDDFVLGAPYNAFLTLAGAINGARTHIGGTDVAGTRIWIRAGSYTYFGGTVTAGTRASFNVEFNNYPGETVRITGASGTAAFPVPGYLKFHGITFQHSTGNITYLEKAVWLDSCFDNRTGGALAYFNPNNYLTRCKINYARSSPSATNNDPTGLYRSCEFKYGTAYSTIIPYCMIGCWTSHLTALILRLDYAGITAPKPDGCFIGWNRLTFSNNIIDIYGDSSNTHGLFFVNNIFEKTSTSTALMVIAGGNNSMDVNQVVMVNNTFVGERCNLSYNDVALTDSTNLRYRRYWWSYNNIFHRRARVTDKDPHTGDPGNQRFGNWWTSWGTSEISNIMVNNVSYYGDAWGNKYLMPNITWDQSGGVNNYIKFVDDNSYPGGGTGYGDYHLAASSPADSFSLVQPLGYDMDGNARAFGGDIGAYAGTDEGTGSNAVDSIRPNPYYPNRVVSFYGTFASSQGSYYLSIGGYNLSTASYWSTTVVNDTIPARLTRGKWPVYLINGTDTTVCSETFQTVVSSQTVGRRLRRYQ